MTENVRPVTADHIGSSSMSETPRVKNHCNVGNPYILVTVWEEIIYLAGLQQHRQPAKY